MNPPSFEEYIGDEEYIYIFERFIYPVLYEWEPELIIISSGFDCMRNDPLGGNFVSILSLGHILMRLLDKI